MDAARFVRQSTPALLPDPILPTDERPFWHPMVVTWLLISHMVVLGHSCASNSIVFGLLSILLYWAALNGRKRARNEKAITLLKYLGPLIYYVPVAVAFALLFGPG
jgi:hypothetical protein